MISSSNVGFVLSLVALFNVATMCSPFVSSILPVMWFWALGSCVASLHMMMLLALRPADSPAVDLSVHVTPTSIGAFAVAMALIVHGCRLRRVVREMIGPLKRLLEDDRRALNKAR